MVAIITDEDDVELRHVDFEGGTRSDYLRPGDWSLLASNVEHQPGRVTCKLTYDEKSEKVHAEVVDHVQESTKRTRFVQVDGKWEFETVKQ